MVRRFHRSIYDELDELRASMDYLYQLALEPTEIPLLPVDETPVIVCRSLHDLNAEITLDDDEVTVTLDTLPGTGNSRVSMDLPDEMTLAVTCDYGEDDCVDNEEKHQREERSFSLRRLIPLPHAVLKQNARASMSHGVLDIHLKRSQPARS
jgi:HSP20 family molecular chaperone IbpA